MLQTEWYELQQKGKLSDEDVAVVPDLYLRNRQLDGIIQQLRKDLEKAQEVAEKAKNTWDKLRKERDFHRMHHKRVVQEKNKLVVDIKRLKKHYSHFEPTLKELQHKYEVAMKEKMLMRLERDKLSHKVESLERTVKADVPKRSLPSPNQSGGKSQDKKISMTHAETNKENANEDSVLPPDDRENPFLDSEFDPPKVENMSLRKTFKAHGAAVSNICVHPRKPILGTCSDDGTWRMYSIPNGDLIMSGDGHKDWVSGMDFHPRGTHAVTGSGDGTVKIWSFSSASCTSTLRDHTQAVWSVAYHDLGDFVVSASMDHTAKLWDTATGRCQQTFRGHVDSVNHVTFQPFSNNICTASGDKTVSLWDSRSGLCIQTFYGHLNSVTCAAFSLRVGNQCDSCWLYP
uniref:Sperm-associated antigen 16 protein n=1 Tax=Palpitomonas bilix TaxID=652834 RepID=A0A7S3GHL0_9EUKA|mmetsp:Transcript_49681/g.127756  ORF Transcript_49681/g.127756 Transcript_49681/m.127756 type:complete len:401 (+) Transcript_49681:66-1268(+)